MQTIPLDPLAATIHLRIEELRNDAQTHRPRRRTRTRPARPAWPAAVLASLRESVSRPTARSRGAGEPCPTC